MKTLKINPKFKDLLPPLSAEEYSGLEENILEHGIQDTIKTWHGVIVDGHNRYDIAQKNDLDFETLALDFNGEDAALEWIIGHQLAHRNLEPNIKTMFLGQLQILYKKRTGRAKNTNSQETNDLANGVTVTPFITDETPSQPQDKKEAVRTSEKIAKEQGVSRRTVERAAQTVEAFEKADKDTQKKFKEGKITAKDLQKSVEKKVVVAADFPTQVRELAFKIQVAITKVQKINTDLHQVFREKGIKLVDIAPSIAVLHEQLKQEEIEVAMLKGLTVCPETHTKGTKCVTCNSTGFTGKDTAKKTKLFKEVTA